MTTIQLEHIKKQYPNGFTAIHDLSLEIQDQEFLVLVGSSGCGKTTLLRLIAGLEEPSSGLLKMDGRVMNNVEARDRDIAMVFQNYALYPHLTVFQNMAFSLRMRRVRKSLIREQVEEAAEILGLENLLERKPGELSGGQRQRVAMGRAIVRHPKVFLMDEPLSNLDAKLRVEMRKEISRLYRKLKTTFIYVTHDQIEAMTLGTRVVVMDHGDIRQSGAPQELYEKPANVFVAGFIGKPEMNFMPLEASLAGTSLLSADASLRDKPEMSWMPCDASLAGKSLLPGEACSAASEKTPDPKGLTASLSANGSGGKIILGVRPEHIRITPATSRTEQTEQVEQAEQVPLMRGHIKLKEMLGDDELIYVENDEQKCVVLTPSREDLLSGRDVFLSAEKAKLHFFDEQTGEALACRSF